MNALSMVILAGATFAVLLAAMPAVVRAAGEGPRGIHVARGAGRAHPFHSKAPAAKTPRFDPRDSEYEEDDGPVGDINSPPGLPAQPKLWDDPPSAAPSSAEPSPAQPREGSIRTALAKRDVTLRDGPREGGVEIGAIKAGDQVVLIREVGAWALVVHSGNMGWAPKSEITVR